MHLGDSRFLPTSAIHGDFAPPSADRILTEYQKGVDSMLSHIMSRVLITAVLMGLLLASPVAAQTNVVYGSGLVGAGVSLDIWSNGQWIGIPASPQRREGLGFTDGGMFHSPSGAPDLWFRGAATPTFPGALDAFAEWSLGDFGDNQSGIGPYPYEGAVHGTDNWMKVKRDSDGCVSWARFTFDFSWHSAAGHINGDRQPILLEIPLYVTRTDCADFPLSEAVAALSPTPVKTTTWGRVKALYR